MTTIFDIGMYDGADTAYYLECGYQVVAVDANPELVDQAKRRFHKAVSEGQLTIVNGAISPNGEMVDLILSGEDLGSSSLFSERLIHKHPSGIITVPGLTLQELIEQHGVPEYIKIDIEGADGLCVLALQPETGPTYISFEVGTDAEALVSHAAQIGFTGFKIINQITFRELANQDCLFDRLTRRLMHEMGFREPKLIKRAGRFFIAGHSSGPLPWESDGSWHSGEATCARLQNARTTNSLSGWYDIHATRN